MRGLHGTDDLRAYAFDLVSGGDLESAVDNFRYNLAGLSPLYPRDQGKIFYKSNIFYAPLVPYRPIFIHTSWQANDPLVHHHIGDLLDLSVNETDRVNFIPSLPLLNSIGQPNPRYEPWGGNPFGFRSVPTLSPFELAAKDPLIGRPDHWDFPSQAHLSVSWVGRVHRGTPWQTLFLKSTNVLLRPGGLARNLPAWQTWTGNSVVSPFLDTNGGPVPDALFTTPTNDWRLVSLLAALFNTNDVHALVSVNEPDDAEWAEVLDGMTVLTNTAPGRLDYVLISSNSPHVTPVIEGLDATRASQSGQVFLEVGDILATPELSVASPWLNTTDGGISDEAYEILPAQLLPLLRQDSIGAIARVAATVQLQFTGFEGAPYEVQTSTDLVHWKVVSTNYPNNGFFTYVVNLPEQSRGQFFRSRLMPQTEEFKGHKHPHRPHKSKHEKLK